MENGGKIAHRLELLQGVGFSAEDLQSIAADIEDIERIVAELEGFGEATPWISQQTQPSGRNE